MGYKVAGHQMCSLIQAQFKRKYLSFLQNTETHSKISYVWKNLVVMWLLAFVGVSFVMTYGAFFSNPDRMYHEAFITTTESAPMDKAMLQRGDQ